MPRSPIPGRTSVPHTCNATFALPGATLSTETAQLRLFGAAFGALPAIFRTPPLALLFASPCKFMRKPCENHLFSLFSVVFHSLLQQSITVSDMPTPGSQPPLRWPAVRPALCRAAFAASLAAAVPPETQSSKHHARNRNLKETKGIFQIGPPFQRSGALALLSNELLSSSNQRSSSDMDSWRTCVHGFRSHSLVTPSEPREW